MEMVDFAVKYARLGLSVIPISPTSKRPLMTFADKPPMTEKEVRKVWDEFPTANIALKTDRFFVIDIDVGHGDEVNGFDSLKAWEHVSLITPTLQAKTASGGKHLFYLKRDDMTLSQQIGMLPGVDIKAHNNNYVLVAPSATDKGSYEWDMEKSPHKGTMMTASRELVAAINSNRETGSGLQEIYYQSVHANKSKNKTTALFETIVHGFGDVGGRNQGLAKFVGGLLLRKVEPLEAYELAKIANENSLEPLSIKEFERTVESIIRKYKGR